MPASCLNRLEETLDLETAALLARDLSKLDEFSRRKSQAMLELSRFARQGSRLTDQASLTRVAQLREKLDLNLSVLGNHLRAAQEVAGIIASAIETSESDGTYSPPLCHAGNAA